MVESAQSLCRILFKIESLLPVEESQMGLLLLVGDAP